MSKQERFDNLESLIMGQELCNLFPSYEGMRGDLKSVKRILKEGNFFEKIFLTEKVMCKALIHESIFLHFMSIHMLATKSLYDEKIDNAQTLEKIKAQIEKYVFTRDQKDLSLKYISVTSPHLSRKFESS